MFVKTAVLFSWTNALDLAGPQDQTPPRIRSFLDELGPYWIPLELNAYKVERKEQGLDPSSGTHFASESFLSAYYPLIHGTTMSLATVVDEMQRKRDEALAATERMKAEVAGLVADMAAVFARDPNEFDVKLPPIAWDPMRPTTFYLRALERLLARESRGYRWMPNDGIDFWHAAVAAGAADFLLLDKQWKRRVLAVAPPKSYQWVFYRHELDAFLDAFDGCEIAFAERR